MIDGFTNGETLDQLSEKYQITKITITKYLKKEIDIKTFKKIVDKNSKKNKENPKVDFKKSLKYKSDINQEFFDEKSSVDASLIQPSFVEIAPLNYVIDNDKQKDLSSVSISETVLPKVVYMIVDNKIELETKLLKDYSYWQFLSQSELNRKTIEIYFDITIAKRFCNREQKVIKVPNTNVFSIVAPLLVSRGISRIVCPDKLIAL
tara:strand:- start:80 stop:697 length:618 start_codon:yes stop_codon:yes gene_type:complete